MSTDPILFGGRQANLYVYVAGDPVNRADPSGLRTWSEDETLAILEDAIVTYSDQSLFGNLWSAFENSGGKFRDGLYDFRFQPDWEDDDFCVPGVGSMNASEFGNYFAGYVNSATLGPMGGALTRVGGVFTHNRRGTTWLQELPWEDDAASVEAINRGEYDAYQRYGGWGAPPPRMR